MWRIIYFFISLLIVLIDYLHYKNLGLKTLTTFFITALIVILFEYYLIRKKSPKNILAFFSSLLISHPEKINKMPNISKYTQNFFIYFCINSSYLFI